MHARHIDSAIATVNTLNFLVRQTIPPIRPRHRMISIRQHQVLSTAKNSCTTAPGLGLSNNRWKAPNLHALRPAGDGIQGSRFRHLLGSWAV